MECINEFIKYKEGKGEKAIYRVHDTRGYTYYSDDYVKWLEDQLHIHGVSDSKDLVIKVKHLVKYLQDNFDMDAKVTFEHMMKPECLEEYPVDAIDYLDKLGTFQNYKGDLWINN